MLVPVTEDDIEDALLTYSPQLRKKIEAGLKGCSCRPDYVAGRLPDPASPKIESEEGLTFKVFLSEKARHDLDNLPGKVADQIIADCKRLADDPIPDGKRIKKLQGYKENRGPSTLKPGPDADPAAGPPHAASESDTTEDTEGRPATGIGLGIVLPDVEMLDLHVG